MQLDLIQKVSFYPPLMGPSFCDAVQNLGSYLGNKLISNLKLKAIIVIILK